MRLLILVLALLSGTSYVSASPGIAAWQSVGDARIAMGTAQNSIDTFDSSDVSALVAHGWMAGSYHAVDEWGDQAGFYRYDFRAPLELGQTKTWMLYVWGIPGDAVSDFGATWAWSPLDYDPFVQSRLELVQKPTGVTGGPELGTVWTTPPSQFALPLYTTNDGLTGYGFKFTLTMVPEPSSLFALGLAASGLGGFVLRRRRR